MSKNLRVIIPLLGWLLLPVTSFAQSTTGDWPSFSFDQQRSGWNQAEITLSPKNVSRLRLIWTSQLSTPVVDTALSTVTAPLVAPFSKILPNWKFSGFVVDFATVAAIIVFALAGSLLLMLFPYPRKVAVTYVTPANDQSV